MKTLAIFLLLFSSSYLIGQGGGDSRKIRFEIPDDFQLVDKSELREVYQDKSGTSFAYDIGRQLNSDEDVPIISAMTAAALSKSLIQFELIHHEKEVQIGDKTYALLIYSCTQEGQNVYNSLFLTSEGNRLITFSFACPLEIAESQVPLLEEIMGSVIFI